jgi:hypothetical protein
MLYQLIRVGFELFLGHERLRVRRIVPAFAATLFNAPSPPTSWLLDSGSWLLSLRFGKTIA